MSPNGIIQEMECPVPPVRVVVPWGRRGAFLFLFFVPRRGFGGAKSPTASIVCCWAFHRTTPTASSQEFLGASPAPTGLGTSSRPRTQVPHPTAHGCKQQSQFVVFVELLEGYQRCVQAAGEDTKVMGAFLARQLQLKVFLLPLCLSSFLISHPFGAFRPAGRAGIKEQDSTWPRILGTHTFRSCLNHILSYNFNQSNRKKEINDLPLSHWRGNSSQKV